MSEYRHPWYSLPWRAVLLAGALAASFVRDWLPKRTCRNCWYRHEAATEGTLYCIYRRAWAEDDEIVPNERCEQWKARKD